ncbi:YbaK/EbsC family protein [Niveibacterium sp. SC-1]|uniref:YbaK/EbsC family protein n=1 Tax=Niveibacterium sp. SC-1 TaxID=3135646 RepID=UPI00311FA1BE
MKPASHPTALRFQARLEGAGMGVRVVEFEQPTRTSVEAAAAIGCTVAEIAKSILFRGERSGEAILIVASGVRRVSEAKVAAIVEEALARADADFVRESTGYAVGGVPPFGHIQPLRILLDRNLQAFERLWAAAGTPFAVFPLSPAELAEHTGAHWADVTED